MSAADAVDVDAAASAAAVEAGCRYTGGGDHRGDISMVSGEGKWIYGGI